MEGSADVNESVDNSAEAPHVKIKENNQLHPPTNNCLTLQDHPPAITEDIGWIQHLSSLQSTEMLLETLAGKDPRYDLVAHSVLGPPASSCPFNIPGGIMKEPELKKFKLADANVCTSSGNVEDSSVRNGSWKNLTRIASGSRLGDSRKVAGSFISSEKKNFQLPQFNLNYTNNSNNAVEIGVQDLPRIKLANQAPGIRTRALPASGFRQFLTKTTLKGKGVANCQNDTGIEVSKVKNIDVQKQMMKEDDIALIGVAGGHDDSNAHHDRLSLRDWLKRKHDMSNKLERLRMFKQILELVAVSHSQSRVLQQLKPSYFVLSPSGLVKYIGSLSTQEVTPESFLKRKISEEYDDEYQASLKHKLLGFNNQTVMQGRFAEDVYDDNIRTTRFDPRLREQIQQIDSYRSSSIHEYQKIVHNSFQVSESRFMNLEDIWYASPEWLNQSACSLSSNIYSLGVLFFELFCSFEMEEVHLAAMANLRHRILPPNFLSEFPKEAGFCLWLLHPDPSSRPKSREILLSNLIVEINKDSAKGEPSPTCYEEDAEEDLLLFFLSSLKDQKEKQAAKLFADIQCLETDVKEVEGRNLSRVSDARVFLSRFNKLDMCPREVSSLIAAKSSRLTSSVNEEKMIRNINQLEHAYFSMRSNFDLIGTNVVETRSDVGVLKLRDNFHHFQHEAGINAELGDHVGAFFEGLCKYARYSRFEVCGSLRNADILNSANVICSLSFDRDEEYFAAAGVSKKIKIFEFGSLLNDTVDVHYPLIELSSRSKLSCVSWNSYIKNYLASTDYDGVVQLWDATTGQGFTQYAEHVKRAWSVDFSPVDPTKLASGSDDCSVKLWNIKERNCIDTIRNVANVCCVQFSPHSSHLLTFGSADYKIYCYDLRNSRSPWCTLSGHGKAVSYVKFVDCQTLVSASTDNTLKLWDLSKSSTSGLSTNACSQTFTGHTNEKNFVGLTAYDGYIACGSETNEVFLYYKALPMPITSHKFGSVDPITGQETGDDNGQFVSSVCWRTKSNMVVAANSSGSLKLLQLVSN